MKRFCLGIFFFVFFQFVFAQERMVIDFQEIKSKIENQDSDYFYPKLLSRFNEFDESLTTEEYSLIYYGFTFQNDYLKDQPEEKNLNELMEKKNYKKLVVECEKILRKNPVSLSANDKMGYSLYKLNKPESEWQKYQQRYRAIRKVIALSGTGLSCENAFKVIYVSDEYNMLYSYFDVEDIHKQSLVGLCDKFEIEPTKYFQAKEIYFDISRKLLRQEELLKK